MNTFWLKIAGIVVAVLVLIILVKSFLPSGGELKPAEKPKTFYDMADRDRQFLEEPKAAGEQPGKPAPEPQAQVAQQLSAAPTQPAGRTPGVVLPSDIKGTTTLYFKPLEEIEDIQAQELLPWAAAGRSIGRLPIMQYGLMVKACRQIEQRWPDSWYAFRAKQMLEEIVERYAANYKITEEELDIRRFTKPRQGAEPRTVEPIRR